MAEYKCISCGAVKNSEASCSCPTCGYRMFEAPYDRREVLTGEIRSFIKRLELSEIEYGDLSYVRPMSAQCGGSTAKQKVMQTVSKEMDDQRFPVFDQIRDYVCGAGKTEIFKVRLDTTISRLRKHIHEPFSQEYRVDLGRVKAKLEGLDSVLKQALAELGVEVDLAEAVLPDIKLAYSEEPDPALLELADRLLDELEALSAKLHQFIKQNNIYGTAYRKHTAVAFRSLKEATPADALADCLKTVSQINAKKYVVDIFSDGSDELGEMLKSLWNTVYAVMTLPVLKQDWRFTFADGDAATDRDIRSVLAKKLQARYGAVNAVIDSAAFLTDREETAVFALYDKMIELDSFGFMGVNKEDLLHIGESEQRLNALIGLSSVKESIQKIKAYALANKNGGGLNLHMCFYGNPGTGKTEVARMIAGILHENGILPTKKVVEVDRSGLVSQYFGATAEKTQRAIRRAMGGVLFVDEAYALANNSDMQGTADYGREALDTLVKAMEDYRGKLCVILAGYRNEMSRMLSVNPGMRSRIQFELDFPNYSGDELRRIAALMLKQRRYTITEPAMDKILAIADVKRREPNFANAREIRNIVDQVIMCQSLRMLGSEDREIGTVDVDRYIRDAKLSLPASADGAKKILTGDEELEQLIGLSAVKRTIRKIRAYAKRNRGQDDFNLHMCFCGAPGTGKTEVARILSRVLYDAGVLPEAKLVETDAQGLLGRFVGETASKTLAKVNEAMNGVLFIDEAYGLAAADSASGASAYGAEAIAVLLKAMEDHRGQFCVILAGYKDKMETMLSADPGLRFRIQFTLDFPDYTREELGAIAAAFLKKKQYEIDDAALSRLLDVAEYYRNRPNFANARTVRNILDHVIMNQNLRTEDMEEDDLVTLEDVEDYLSDEGIDLAKGGNSQRQIGFTL